MPPRHALLRGDLPAARLLGAAAAARAASGAPLAYGERAEVDRVTARIRTALGDAGFDAAYADGGRAGADAVLAEQQTGEPQAGERRAE